MDKLYALSSVWYLNGSVGTDRPRLCKSQRAPLVNGTGRYRLPTVGSTQDITWENLGQVKEAVEPEEAVSAMH